MTFEEAKQLLLDTKAAETGPDPLTDIILAIISKIEELAP